jgi:uncharacterized protein (DUF1501 family)
MRSFRPTRRGVLGGALASLAFGLSARRARAAEPRNLLVYWVSGGWDPTFTIDPHIGSSVIESDNTATLATVGGIPIADAATRPSVRAFFEQWGSRSIVFNGIAVGSVSHDACTRLILTGQRSGADMDVCTRVAVGSGRDLVLPHVVLGGPRFSGENGALVSLVSPTFVGIAAGDAPTTRDDAQEARVSAWLEAELAATGRGTTREAEFLEGLRRLPALTAFAKDFSAVDLEEESGRRQVAVQLFAAGASRTVLLAGSVAELSQWDSHQQNEINQDLNFEHTFGQLAELMDALETTVDGNGQPLSESTRVLVLSEMGRQPTLNTEGGKDHWPITSALLIGPDVQGGRVIGATDDTLSPLPIDLDSGERSDSGETILPSHLIATMCAGFDLDPGEWADGQTPIGGVWA